MSIKLSSKENKINGTIVIMPEVFKGINCEFDDFKISFNYFNFELEINITSDSLNAKEIEKIYWEFYDYIGIVLGYFPTISDTEIAGTKMNVDLADQYKTKKCFVRGSEQYIKKMSSDDFKNSFQKFRNLNNRIDFQLDMFNVAMMESNHYPEITILNVLQSFDGLYEELYSNKNNSKKIIKGKIKYINNKIESANIENIIDEELEMLKNYMQKIGEISFADKLIFFCNNCEYDIFKYEKELECDNRYYFDNLISLFVNTRNKFSHSIKKKNTLSGTEATTYIFKLIMLYRVIILKELGLSKLIDKNEFLANLKEWDDYIIPTIKKDEEDK